MKFHRSLTATLIAGATALTLAACGDDGEGAEETPTTSTATTEVAAFPTAMELNDILARATDPNVPVEEGHDPGEPDDLGPRAQDGYNFQ